MGRVICLRTPHFRDALGQTEQLAPGAPGIYLVMLVVAKRPEPSEVGDLTEELLDEFLTEWDVRRDVPHKGAPLTKHTD